jgi:hypothetical protein
VCCAGQTCNASGLACSGDVCVACGAVGERCCTGAACSNGCCDPAKVSCIANGTTCSTGGTCNNGVCPTGGGGRGGSGGGGGTGGCGNGGTFPTFAKTCLDNPGCAIGMHQLNCCGSQLAIGISFAEQARFMTAEAAWDATCPACGCPATLPSAEDGKMCMVDGITVRCDNGRCTTHCP